uniref:RRM domain-containing protein n=2 Tax=Cacopsylla melanoneura TaxID=428564 RepID=A0A8D8S0R9_9HEMI
MGSSDMDQFKNTPEMNKLLKDPNGVSRRIFIGGIVPQDGQIDKFRSELERVFRKYGLIEAMIVKKRFSFVQFLHENAATQAIKSENGKDFLGHKMDVKVAKAPPTKREEPEDDGDDNVPSYNIASSLAETLKNLPKEDLAPPPPQNDRFNNSSSGGDHNFDSNSGGRGGRGGGRGGRGGFPSSDRGGRGGGFFPSSGGGGNDEGGRGGGGGGRGGLMNSSPSSNNASPGRGEWGGRGRGRGGGEE